MKTNRSSETQSRTDPVFIFGSGRCGSSVLQRLLSYHPELAWLPDRLCRAFPERPGLSRFFLRSLDLPWFGSSLRLLSGPGEEYEFWEALAPGFSEPAADLTSSDVTDEARQRLRWAFERIATRRRTRVLAKITGWPRVDYLRDVFPAATFVHVARDPRAVVHSMLGVSWWRGREGPERWRWGPLEPELERLWERHGRTAFALACLQMRIYWRALEAAERRLERKRLVTVGYSELCRRPEDVLSEIAAACRLSVGPELERAIWRIPLESRDFQWARVWSEEQHEIAAEILEPALAFYESCVGPSPAELDAEPRLRDLHQQTG